MANKITQLVNKDGDNLYPLSGGTISDSITTDMLQDESVTSDKIDWSTITQTALTPNTSYIDYATKSVYYKFGRLVLVYVNANLKANATGNTNIFTGLPTPSDRTSFVIASSDNKIYRARILENTDAIQIEGGFSGSSGTYISGSVAYFADN